jgi:TP53 regulating kinase and related kinases
VRGVPRGQSQPPARLQRLWGGSYLGRDAIAKERFHKSYRHSDLDERLTKQRTVAEARAPRRVRRLGVRVPTVFLTDVSKGLVVMERIPGPTAKQWLLDHEDEEERKALGREIGSTIAKLHAHGIVHGDLTTSNMIVVDQGSSSSGSASPRVAMIDFGLAQFSTSQPNEERGVDLYVLERAFLSTHARSEAVFEALMEGYRADSAWRGSESGLDSLESLEQTMKHLEVVRARGRKRLAFG